MTTDTPRTPDSGRVSRDGEDRLASGKLGVAHIVFFVIAAAAPLAVFVGTGPLALRFGGIGAPGAFLLAGMVFLLFASGFTAMSQHVQNAGAFYAYVDRGLGRRWGGGAAVMTMAAYGICSIGFMGYAGYYAEGTVSSVLGIDLPWQFWTFVFATVVTILGYSQVDIGARVLGFLIVLEVGVIAILTVGVLRAGGPERASATPFSVENVLFSPGSGTLILLCFGAFIGFESTAIYSEEARRPEKTITRATYIAVVFLAVLHASTFWVFSYGFGVKGAEVAAQKDDFLNMAFMLSDTYVGSALTTAFEILILTSYLALIVAFHNACTRYLFSMGRTGILPRFLSKTHPKMSSPYCASLSLSTVTFIALTVAMVARLDPFLQLGTWLYAAGIIGVLLAQVLCGLAVVAFFWRDRRGHHVARVLVAPVLGSVGLLVALWLSVSNFSVISGYTDVVPNAIMIGAMPLVFLLGVGMYRRNGTRAPQVR